MSDDFSVQSDEGTTIEVESISIAPLLVRVEVESTRLWSNEIVSERIQMAQRKRKRENTP